MKKYHLRILHSSAQSGCYFEETVMADDFIVDNNGNVIKFYKKNNKGYSDLIAMYPTARTIVYKIENATQES